MWQTFTKSRLIPEVVSLALYQKVLALQDKEMRSVFHLTIIHIFNPF